MTFLFGFLIGGYLIPAIRDAQASWIAEADAPDSPSTFERAMTAVIGGIMWPAALFRAEASE